MFATDPVSIRKIDSDRSRRIAVSRKNCHIDDLGCNTLYLFLLEAGIHR